MDKPGEVASEKLNLQTFETINKVFFDKFSLCLVCEIEWQEMTNP